MAVDRDRLFDLEVWRPALMKYEAVTHLNVTLYDADTHVICCDPVKPDTLFALFRESGCLPGVLSECARHCLNDTNAHEVIVSTAGIVGVVGTPLVLEGETLGAAVAGFAMVDFCQSALVSALARRTHISFGRLWAVARQTHPISEHRLHTHGELLQVLADTVLRQQARSVQVQAFASDLERRIEQRTRELALANQSLKRELLERQQAETRIRNLVHGMTVAQEEERRRIARDVHDHLGQQVTALRLRLELLETDQPGTADWQTDVRTAQETLARLDRDLVSFTRALRPLMLDEFGLARALESFAEEWSRHSGIAVAFQTIDFEPFRFDPEVEIHLFRVAQEALNNIHKHAHATRVGLTLHRRGDTVVLTIEDDGVGFDLARVDRERPNATMGIRSIRERVELIRGTVEIETAEGQGTTVIVSVPLPGPSGPISASPRA